MKRFSRSLCRRSRVVTNHRGMALLMTLAIITLLVTAGLELNRRMRSAVYAAATARDRFVSGQMAAAAIHAGMALLIKDKLETRADSLQEEWASPEKRREALAQLPFPEGEAALEITDERARIQLNALVAQPGGQEFNPEQEMLLDRFLRSAVSAFDAVEQKDPLFEELNLTTTIISALKDWIDAGDDDATTGLSGAESDYYLGLDPPYSCPNAPLAELEELLRVKGMTRDLFYGLEEIPGVSGFLTVHGIDAAPGGPYTYDGRININTAELPVIRALLPTEYADLAGEIADYRLQADNEQFLHDLSRADWYHNVPGLADIELDPELVTVSSDLFRLQAAAVYREVKCAITAVVQREKNKSSGRWHCKVLSWRES